MSPRRASSMPHMLKAPKGGAAFPQQCDKKNLVSHLQDNAQSTQVHPIWETQRMLAVPFKWPHHPHPTCTMTRVHGPECKPGRSFQRGPSVAVCSPVSPAPLITPHLSKCLKGLRAPRGKWTNSVHLWACMSVSVLGHFPNTELK